MTAAVIIHERDGKQTAGPLPPCTPEVTSEKCNPQATSLVRALRRVADLDHMQICQSARTTAGRLPR